MFMSNEDKIKYPIYNGDNILELLEILIIEIEWKMSNYVILKIPKNSYI